MTKFVFVTGGVVSSLGKGIASASLATILEPRGLKVTLIKLDPYLNVGPRTMRPIQHGEVFVTDDGLTPGRVGGSAAPAPLDTTQKPAVAVGYFKNSSKRLIDTVRMRGDDCRARSRPRPRR